MSVAAIRHCIAQGDVESARRLLDDWAETAPLTPELRMLEGDLLARAGNVEAAERALRAATQEDPGLLPAWVRLVRLLVQRRQMDEAQEIFLARIWGAAVAQEDQDRLVNQLTSGVGVTPETALAFLARLEDGGATRPVVLIRKGIFLARQSAPAEALAALDRARGSGPLPSYAAALRAELLLSSGRGAAALDEARSLLLVEPEDPRHAEKLILAAAMAGEIDLAAEALRVALRKHPTDWWLIFRFNRLALGPEAVRELFGMIAANAAAHAFEPRALFQYALACLEQDRLHEARGILGRIENDASVAAMAAPLAGALDVVAAGPLPPPRIAEDRRHGVEMVRCPGADAVLMVFAGMMGRFGYLPLSLLDRLLARYRCHVVYLRDTRDASYLRGVEGLGASEEESVARLRAIAAEFGATRILTMGGSVGGFAAMRYGARIPADAVLSLAGPTRLESETARPDKPQHVRRALGRLGRHFDVDEELQAVPGLRLFYAYGADRPSHRRQTERLQALADGLVLRPLASESALTAMVALAQGALFRMLSEDLRLPEMPAGAP